MNSNLKPSDFNICGDPIPEDVVDKIVAFHLKPLEKVDAKVPFKILVSQKSGFRPLWWELERGRSGYSEHVFINEGGADVSCEDFQDNKEALLEALVENTGYTRIADYGTFFHCDRKQVGGKRFLFNKKWIRIRELPW